MLNLGLIDMGDKVIGKIYKILLLVIFFSIILISNNIVSSIDLEGPIGISTSGISPTSSAWRSKAFFYDDKWYIGLETEDSVTSGKSHISRWDSNITTKEDGWDDFIDHQTPTDLEFADWYLYPTNEVPLKTVIEYIGGGDGSVYEQIGNATLTNFAMAGRIRENLGSSLTWVTIGNDGSIFWKESGVVYYHEPDSASYFSTGGDGSLSIPSDFNDITHPYLYWDNANQQYILLVESSAGGNQGIWALYFDSDYTYLDNDGIATGTSFIHQYPKLFGKGSNNYMVSYVKYNDSKADNTTIVIDFLDFNDRSFTSIKQENIIPTNALNHTGETWVNDAFATYSDTLERNFIFYTVVNSSNFIGYYVLKEDLGCSCSDWVNTSTCVENRILQNRLCYPSACGIEEQYVNSSYCDREYNRTHGIYTQGYTVFYNQTYCESGWVETGEGVASCIPTGIRIPQDCASTNVTIEGIPLFDAGFSVFGLDYEGQCPFGRYYLLTCIPTSDCFKGNVSCQQLNFTQSKTSTGFYAGDIATGKVELRVDGSCKCNILISEIGIKRYKVRGILSFECVIPCSDEWVCLSETEESYRRIDCSITNITGCEFGCNELTGRCYSSESQAIEGEGADSPSNIEFWTNFLFSPDTLWKKLAIAIIGSLLIGSFAFVFGEPKDVMPLFFVFFGLGIIFFIVIGYIPLVLILILIASIGIYFFLRHSGSS